MGRRPQCVTTEGIDMIRYEGQKKIFTDDVPRDQTLLIDINAQGIMGLDWIHRRFANAFPETMELLRPLFASGKLMPGMVIKTNEKGYRVLLAVTRYGRVGRVKDDPESVVRNTDICMQRVMELTMRNNDIIASSILNRDINTAWSRIHNVVSHKDHIMQWVVYPS